MSKTFTLNTPVTTKDGVTVTEVTVNEPTAGMLEMAESSGKSNMGLNAQLIGLAAGIHPDIVRQFALSDFFAILEYVQSFLPSSLLTGAQ
jgi:hypothetical protein